jgi:hypothetical protein
MKKIGLIVILVVLVLGIIGVGYAAWSQNINVTGNVGTGSYIVKIAQPTTATAYNEGGSIPLSGTATITVGSVTPDGPSAGFSVTIANGYPGLVVNVPYTITETGSIPANITAMTINSVTWTGTAKAITLNDGSYNDVNVYNLNTAFAGTPAPTSGADLSSILNTHSYNLAAISSPALHANSGNIISGYLVIEIPDTLVNQEDALSVGGLNSGLSQTFNFQINTNQAP